MPLGKCEKVLKMAKQKSMTSQLQAAFNLDRHRNGIEKEKSTQGKENYEAG